MATRIKDLQALTSLTYSNAGHHLIVDDGNGTKRISLNDLAKALDDFGEPDVIHRGIFRGKNLGMRPTAEQYAEIANNTFHDIYIGDYWQGTSSSIKMRVADINYYMNTGDTKLNRPHIVVVPDCGNLGELMANPLDYSSSLTPYITNSKIQSDLNALEGKFRTFFGETHLIPFRNVHRTSYTAQGIPNTNGWYTRVVELMTEMQVLGRDSLLCTIGYRDSGGMFYPNRYSIDVNQFALFELCPSMRMKGNYEGTPGWWLRDPFNSSNWCMVNTSGTVTSTSSATSHGICRPYFLIG